MLAIFTNHFSTLLLLAILLAAVIYDLRAHRIPNWLSLSTIVVGFGLQYWFVGMPGVVSGWWGLCTAFGLLILFYAARGMGAGDVKLMMGIGVFLGPGDTAIAVGFTLLCGATAGLAILLWRRGLGEWLRRYWLMLRTLLLTLRPMYVPPSENAVAAQRFPYAAAIATGTIMALWWLMQLEPLAYTIRSAFAG